MRSLGTILCASILVAACGAGGGSSVPAEPIPTASSASPGAGSSPTTDGSASLAATAAPHPTPVAATWVEAGTLNVPRVVTKLGLLGTGEVLAVGEDNVCDIELPPSDTAETWDPQTATWTMTSRLPSPRIGAVLASLVDGRALVTGGANRDYVSKSSTVVYDPVSRAWTTSGLLGTARMAPGVAALDNGGALVVGGLLIDGSQEPRALASAETWDPATDAWSAAGHLHEARQNPSAVTLTDGRVLVVGGVPSGADDQLPTAEIYDPATGRWTAAGTLATPPSGLSLVALPDGDALAARPDGDARVAIQRYERATNGWSAVTYVELPAGVVRATLAPLRDGRALLLGSRDARIYDPGAGTWSATRSMPGVRNDPSAVLLDDGSVLVAGGWAVWVPDTPGCPTAETLAWRLVPATP